MKSPLRVLALCLLWAGACVSLLPATIRLPSIVSDGMVLQRDAELTVWGWADPGETVTVTFRDQRHEAATGADGRWEVSFAPLHAGGPDPMVIEARHRIVLEDVLVGDVWFCSGQSNMTHTFVRWQERYAQEIAAAEVPEIRQFHVPTRAVLEGPETDFAELAWKRASPDNLLDFTVVGYFFAKQLHERYDVPQGLILSAVGGTPIEAWTSEAGFREFPDELAKIALHKDTAYVQQVNAEAQAAREAAPARSDGDAGLAGPLAWHDPAYTPRHWKPIHVPGYWEDQGVRDLDGVVWYRREVEVPASLSGLEAVVKLGRIRNADELYVNGERVGHTTYEYPQRRYTIPAGLLRAGPNLFVVRVTNSWGKGGFIPDKPYALEAAGERIDLSGEWHYRVGEVYRPQPPLPSGISAQNQPAALYHGMVAPFTDYALRGVLWYQGESNAGDPEGYAALLPNLIDDWREQWDHPDLLFLIAQLPNYMDVDYLPPESNWARMREVQFETSKLRRHVGIGINIELGEWNDIHPAAKKEVGERLALQARRLFYGEEDLIASGPVFRAQEIRGDHLVLHFDEVGDGLVSRDGEPLAHFAIAGEDKQFRWAEAKIDGDTVVVWRDDVPNPRYVRYAWADNPDFANLSNQSGLPAAPFRTDP
ncbi:MAG: sialate O-acetylesterase [Opitutales bacterium]